MQHLSTAFLITALAIVVSERVVIAQNGVFDDLLAIETKNNALTVINGPKNVKPPISLSTIANQTYTPEQRPPSKPPINLTPDKKYFYDLPPHFFNPAKKLQAPPVHVYTKEPLKLSNSVYKFPNSMPMQHVKKLQALPYSPTTRQPVAFAASSSKTTIINSPKFSLPVQTINGIRTDFVKPPKIINLTTTTTTTTEPTTTTKKVLRTKRIWPKRILEKYNLTSANITLTTDFLKNNVTNKTDLATSSSRVRVRYANTEKPVSSSTVQPTTRVYRRVTRVPKTNSTTQATKIEPNDWIPIIPPQYPKRKPMRTRISKRSDIFLDNQAEYSDNKKLLYIQPYGLLPVGNSFQNGAVGKKMVFFRKKKQINPFQLAMSQGQASILNPLASYVYPSEDQPNSLNPYAYASEHQPNYIMNPFAYASENNPKTVLNPYAYDNSPKPNLNLYAEPSEQRPKTLHGYRAQNNPKPAHRPSQVGPEDQRQEGSQRHSKVVTKIKHHHHHHHHRYIKTVEKPVNVPVKVEVPKPYPVEKKVPVPVPVEKIKIVDRPYPVTVEKKVPYPVAVKVPHPVPYKVVEKEYVPKPYPVVHHVPVVKHVEVKVPQPVPVEVEKKVPVPVQVAVPVEKQVPVRVEVEKKVPYPVPVKVIVPQPYAVEKRVPYPVEVKVREPVEVIRHVAVRVPVPQPYPVKVPQPIRVEVEKRVPYPVHVEKRVPVPYEVYVPQKVEVEKKVPVYIPKPYPVEKKVPYPVKVPYAVKVPVKVPVEVPVEVPVYIHHPFQIINDDMIVSGPSEQNEYSDNRVYIDRSTDNQLIATSTPENQVTGTPQHTVTVHGNTGYNGFVSRSDSSSTTPSTSS